jgi:hypothetical protein
MTDGFPSPTRLRGRAVADRVEAAGWVAPGNAGPALYLICYRGCPDTQRLKAALFPDLLAAGVDIRVITIARRDKPGVGFSTPEERATVAELWLHRDWALARRWDAAPASAWKAEGIPPADGDPEREAAVEAGRRLTEDLVPMLLADGLVEDHFRFPTLFWPPLPSQGADGWKAMVCEDADTWPVLRATFGLAPV